MKIKLDENIPASLVGLLNGLGHDADNVLQEGLEGENDPTVWAAAQSEGRFLITQDLDFSDVRQFQPGTHAGILLVRLQNPNRRTLAAIVERIFTEEDVETWHSAFVVVTERKLRVRRA